MSSPVRVGLVLDHPSPHMAGLLESLSQRTDVRVQVVYLRRTSSNRHWGDAPGPLPYRVAEEIPGGILAALGMVNAQRWVVATIYTSIQTWLAVAWLRWRARGPWVYMNEPLRPRYGVAFAGKRLMLRLATADAAGFASTGPEAVARYQREVAKGRRVVSMPYFVDLTAFRQLPRRRLECKTPIRILYVASFLERKDHFTLLRALRRLPTDTWTLTLVGEGPLKSHIEQLSAWARPGQVRFLGSVPYANRQVAFRDQDVFVMPSKFDGWGMVLVEALAAGLPVVTTQEVMAAHELIDHGVNGFMVPVDDPKAMASSLRWVLEHRQQLAAMQHAARASVASHRAEPATAQLIELLAQVSGPKDESGPSALTELSARAHPVCPKLSIGSLVASLPSRARRRLRHSALDAWSIAALGQMPRGGRILAYHQVFAEDRQRFRAHLAYVNDHFEVCLPREFVRRLTRGQDVSHLLALTFDDGFRLLMDDCLEILECFNYQAGFFVPSNFVMMARDPIREAAFCRAAHGQAQNMQAMSVDDLTLLANLGHEIGSHGVDHLGLDAVQAAQAKDELVESRYRLSHWLPTSPVGFAYPYGVHKSQFGSPPQWVQEAGYAYALTMDRGQVRTGSDPYLLPREHVEGAWPLRHLRTFLSA